MENDKRQPFKKYKQLRVYFSLRTYVLKNDDYWNEIDRPFDWFKFSSRGVIFKDKQSGMLIHLKYSSVEGAKGNNNSRALVLEDVELYTPFIKEDNKVKFITWEEWDAKYNTEEICKRIISVTDEHLKEHNTDLMYILDKLCVCAADRTFDYPLRFIKVEPRYQDNEYSLHRVAAGFKWYHGGKIFDDIKYSFEYTAENRTIHIDISKHETWHMPSNIFQPSAFLSSTLPDDHISDSYSISIEFNKDYSISKVTVKNKNKENLLKFMEMGNPVIKNTIRQIRDYINSKLEEKQLTSRINVTNEQNMYIQTWDFSPRVDVRPYIESSLKVNEHRVIDSAYYKIWEYLNTKMTDSCTWMIKKGEPYKFEYNYGRFEYLYGAFKKTEIVNVRTINNDSFINLLFQSTDKRALETVYNMEITITFDDDGNIKDYAMINKELIDKFKEKYIINLIKFLEEMCPDLLTWPFTLNKHGDIYTQIKNECEYIYNHPNTAIHTDELTRTSTCTGYVLYLSSGRFEEATRERIRFEFDSFSTFHRITIEILDPNREKLKVTLGIEGTELVSIGMSPGFDKFENIIYQIYNPRVRRLISEIFNKLYKGE